MGTRTNPISSGEQWVTVSADGPDECCGFRAKSNCFVCCAVRPSPRPRISSMLPRSRSRNCWRYREVPSHRVAAQELEAVCHLRHMQLGAQQPEQTEANDKGAADSAHEQQARQRRVVMRFVFHELYKLQQVLLQFDIR